MTRNNKSRNPGNNLKWIFRTISYFLLFFLTVSNTFGQVTGTPQSGQSAVVQCSPAIYDISYKFTFLTPANPTGTVRLLFILYTQGSVLVSSQTFEPVPIQPGVFKYVEQTATFPIPYTGDCEYFVEILMYYDGAYVNSAYQLQKIGIWHTDDMANGVIAITPDIKEVCEGNGLADFRFQDASTFACVDPAGQNPNIIERHVQFVYGTDTNSLQGIPNLYINDGSSDIYLTDATGAPIIFPTASGFYEGPIISTGPFPLGGSQQTYPIYFDGVGTVVNDYFEVTVRNWNYCNPWNLDTGNPNAGDAKTSTARIVIIDSPPSPTVPDKTICFGDNRTLSITSGAPVGEYRWYSDIGLTILVDSGVSSYTPPPPNDVPSVYDYWVTDAAIPPGNGCESPATKVTLTIREPLTLSDVIDGPTEACVNENGLTFSLSDDPPNQTVGGSTIYEWTLPGDWTINSQGTLDINIDVGGSSGSKTVSVVLKYTTAPDCPTAPVIHNITVYPATVGGSITGGATPICFGNSTGTMTLSGYTGSIQRWEKRVNSGAWSNISNNTTTYSETPSSAGTWDYRAYVQSGTCSGVYSSTRTIIVNPTTIAGTVSGGTTPICLGDNTGVMTLTGNIGSVIRWQKQLNNGSWQNINITDSSYSEVPTASGNWDYRVQVKSGACNTLNTNQNRIVVDPTSVGGSVTGATTPLCLGEGTGTMTLSGHVGTIVKWQKRLNGVGLWTDIANNTTTYSETPSSVGSWEYRANLKSGTCPDTYSNPQIVIVNPLPTDLSGSVTVVEPRICYGDNTDIRIAGSQASVNYYLRTGGVDVVGPVAGGGLITLNTEAITSTTIYQIHAVNATTGCDRIFGSYTVTVNNELAVTASVADADATICLGEATTFSVGFTATGSGSGYTYDWLGDNSDNFSGNNVSFAPTTTGFPITFTATVADDFGPTVDQCEATAQTTLTVNPIPGTPTITPAPGTSICYGSGSITLTAAATNALYYQWYFNTNPMTDSVDADIVLSEISESGNYTVRAYGNNPTNCEGPPSAITTISINPLPAPSISGATSVCLNATETYSTAGGNTYLWTVNFGSPQTPLTNNTVDVRWDAGTGTGWVMVKETLATGCWVETPHYDVTVLPGAPAAAPTGLTGPAEKCEDENIDFDCDDVVNATQYIWDISYDGTADDEDFVTATSNVTIDLTGVTPGNHTIKVKARNACGDGPWTATRAFAVNSLPDLSAASDIVCSDAANSITLSIDNPAAFGITTVSYTINSITDNGLTDSDGTPRQGLTGQPANILQSETWTNTNAVNTNVIYSIIPVSDKNCSGSAEDVTITINPEPVINPNSETICSGSSPTITVTSNIPGSSFSWEVINITGGVTGTTVGNTGATATIGETLSNVSGAVGSVTYRFTATGPVGLGSCVGATEDVIITVNPEPVINPNSETICSGNSPTLTMTSNLAGSTFGWEVVNVTGTIGGTAVGNTGSGATISQTLTNTSGAVGSVTYRFTATGPAGLGSCAGATEDVVITVNPEPVINPNSETICSGSSPSITMTSNLAGSSFGWEVVSISGTIGGTAVGNTGSGASISQTLTNTSGAVGSVTYRFTATGPVGLGSCVGATEDVIITVNPEPVINPNSESICSGTSPTITVTSNVPGSSFSWEVVNITGGVTGTTVGNTGATATIGETLTNVSGAVGSVTYRFTATGPVGLGSCIGPTEDVIITVNPEPVINPNSETICSSNSPTLTMTSNLAGSTFGWEVVNVTGTIGGTAVGNTGSGATIGQTLTNTSGAGGSVTYRFTATGPVGLGSCVGATEDVVVTVNPEPAINPNSETICSGSSPSITITSNLPGSTFSWEVVSISGTIGGTAVGNTGTGTTISQTLTNTSGAVGSVTYRFTATGPVGLGSCVGATEDVIITVNPEPVINPNSESICSGNAPTITVTSNVPGSSFNWEVMNITGGVTGTSVGNTGTTATIGETLSNVSGAAGTVTYRFTATGPVGLGSCVGATEDVIITVNPEPVINPNSETICSSNSPTLAMTSNLAGSTFEWEVINVTGTIGGTAVGNTGSGATISQTLTNTSGAVGSVTYRFTATGPVGLGSCVGATEDVVVTVNPEPAINPNSETICSGSSPSITITSNLPGSTFSWEVVSISGTIGGTAVGNTGTGTTISQTLTNTSGAVGSVTYRFTATGPVGLGSCVGATEDVIITVNPEPVISPNSETICSGNSPTITVTSNVPGSSFSWEVVNITGGVTGTSVGNTGATATIGETLTNVSGAGGSVTYRFTATGPVGLGSCVGAIEDVIITVNPEPVINPNSETICSGNSPTLTMTSNLAGSTFGWEVVNVTGTIGGTAVGNTGSGTTIGQTLTNTSGAVGSVTYRFTATGPVGLGSCVGATVDVVVTVNPSPLITPQSETICSSNTPSITIGSNLAGSSYSWEVVAVTGSITGTTIGNTGVGTALTETLTNISSASGTVTYRISANGPVGLGSCPATQEDYVITVKPEPVVTALQNPNTCSDVPLDYLILMDNFSNPGDNVTFTWPAPDLTGVLTGGTARIAPGSGLNITDVFTNTGGSVETATYHIAPVYNGCAGDTVDLEVDVGAEPILADLDDEACSDFAIGLILNTAPGSVAAANYDITDVDVDPSLNFISGATVPQSDVADDYLQNDIYRNITGGDLDVLYTVVPKFNPVCVGDEKTITITIHPEPIVLLGQTKTICSGEAVDMEILLNPPNIPAGSEFRWDAPTMSDASSQGTAQSGVIADPAGTIHITDVLINEDIVAPYTSITATYYVSPTSIHSCDGDQIPVIITVKPKPNTTAISGAAEACINTANMVYSVTPTGGSKYYWKIPASLGTVTFGGAVNDAFFIMNAAATGATDTLRVIEQNSFLCWGDTIKKQVIIHDYPPAAVVAGTASVCAGDADEIYSVPNNAGSVYTWTVPIGAAITSFPVNVNQITVTFGTMSGNISVVETNPAGCVTNHTPLNVTVNALPNATIAPSKGTICENETVTFTASPAGALNYTFFVEGVEAQDGASRTYATDSLVNGEGVTVEVTSAAGCMKESAASYVTVSPPPVVTVASSDADNEICTGTSVTFTAASALATGFDFRVNSISVQNGASKTYITSALVDGDAVDVIGTTVYGCTGTSNVIVTTVDPLPVASLGSNDTICIGASASLAATITTGTGPFIIQVDQGVGTIDPYDSGDPIVVSPVTTTTYNLQSVIDANGCSVTAPHANLTGQPKIVVHDDISITIQPSPTTKCPASSASFSVAAIGTGPAYQWRKDGVDLSNDGRITGVTTTNLNITNLSAADAGNYDVVVSGACEPDTSIAVALTVLEDIQVTAQPAAVVECPGLPVYFKVDVTGTSPVYRWRKNGTPLTDGGTISGTATDSMSFSSITTLDAGNYDVVVTGTCVSDTSDIAALTLNIPPQITAQPVNKTICEDGTTLFRVNPGTTTAPAYLWEFNTGSGWNPVPGGPVYSGETDDTLVVVMASAGMTGYRYRVVVSGTCSPAITSDEVTLTVTRLPQIAAQPVDATVCEGATVSFTVNPGVTTNPTFSWEVDDGSGWNVISGAPYSGYNTNILGILTTTSALDSLQYRVIVGGACTPSVISDTVNLYINEKPEVTASPVDVTECEDGSVIFVVNPGVTTNPSIQWEVDDGTGFADASGGIYSGITDDTLTVSPISSGMNGWRYRAAISGTCTPDATSAPARLTVNEKPEIITHPSDKTVCENDNTIFTVSAGVTTVPAFEWEYNTGSGWNTVPAAAPYSGTANDTLTITGADPAMDGHEYRVIVSGTCTPADTSNAAILTVNERPEIISQPVDSTICEDADASFTVDAGLTTGATYQWQVSTGAAFNNIFGGIYTGENTATLNISAAPSTMNGYRYRVVIGGSCTPNVISDTAILTVYQKPEITLQPSGKTICEEDNTIFRISTGVTTSPAIQWEYNTGAGWIDVPADANHSNVTDDTLIISSAVSAMNNYRYRAVVTGTCSPTVTSDSVTLTIREKPEIIDQPTDSTICEGSSVTFTVDAGVTSGATYQWQVNTGGGFGNVVGALYSGQTTTTLNIFNVPSTYDGYEYRVIISGLCTPAVTSDTVLLTVHQRPEILTHPTNKTICEDGTTSFAVNAGVTTTPVYTWEVNDGGGFDTITGGVYTGYNTNTLVVDPASSAMNGYSYRVTVSGTCTPEVTSNLAFLTVNEKPEIITDPHDTTVCEGQGTLFSVNAGVTTTPAFLWEVNDGGGWATASGGVYVNATTANLGLTTTSTAMNGYQYRAVISGTCSPADTSAIAVLTIREKPEVTIHPVDITECEDGTVIFGINSGVTTNPAYNWQVDQGFGFFNVSAGIYSGENTDTLTVTGITSIMSGYKYRAVVSGSCAPSVNSNSATLTVDEKPEVIQHPQSKAICEDGSTIFRVNAGVTTGPSFVWEYDTGSGFGPVPADAVHSGVTNDTLFITGAASTMHNWEYRVIVSGTCAPNDTSSAAVLTINEKPEIDVQPLDSAICENANAAFTVDAGVTTNPVYQWQVDPNTGTFGNVSGGIYAGGTTPMLTINGGVSSMNGYKYRAVISGSCTPSVTSDTVTLTVYEKPEITFNPVASTICENDTTFFRVNPGVTTNPAYQWEVDMGSGFAAVVPGPEYSGITDDTLHILGGSSGMNNYKYQVVVSGTCAPDATSAPATLTVRERPEIITQPRDSSICEGSSASFSVDAGVTTTPSYQWQVDKNTGTFVNVSGAGYSGQTTALLNVFSTTSAMNGYLFRVIVSGTCSPNVISDTVTLTIYERPEITVQPASISICEDGTTLFGINSGVTTTPSYIWEVNDGGGFDTITGGPYAGFSTDTLIVTTATSPMNNYSYRVTVSGTCTPPVTSDLVFLTIDEKPEVVIDPQDTTVCEGQGTVFSVSAGATTNPTYLWEVNNGGGWATATGGVYINETTPNLGLTTTSSLMNSYQYRVIIGGKCAPTDTSAVAVLTIREKPEVTIHPSDSTQCEDGTVTFGVVPGVTTNPAYRWQVDQGFGFFNVSGGIYSGETTDTLTITGITSVMNGYKYRAVVSGTCTPSVNSNFATLTVLEKPEVIQHPQSSTICEDGSTIFRVNAGVTTSPAYLWEYDTGGGWNTVPAAAPYSGTTNDTLFVTGAISTMHNYQYRVVISGTCAPDDTSNAAILTINEKPEIAVQPVDSAICEDAGAAFLVDAGATTNPSYQWQVDPNTGTFSNVSGGTYAGGTTPLLIINNAPSSMDGYRYRVIISGTCTPNITSDTAMLTVYQKPEVLANPASSTICEGDNTFFAVNPGVTTNPAYQWEVDMGGGFGAVVPGPEYSGINADTLRIIGGTSAMNDYKYHVVISGTCAPDATSNSATLTIGEQPEIIGQPVDSAICEGSSASFTVDAGVTSNPSYQWQVDPNTGTFANVSGAGYSGQTTTQLNIFNAASTKNGYRYRVIVSGSCTPSVISDTAVLTIYERPEITGQPSDKVVCEDGTTQYTVNPGVTTTPAYYWQVDDGGGYDTITAGPYAGFNTATLTITTASSAMHGYTYRVIVDGYCSPSVTSNDVYLSVDEKPEIITEPQDTTVCEGATAGFTVDPGVTANPTYQWQVNTGAAWANASGAPYTGPTTAILRLTTTNSGMNGYRYRVIVGGKCSPADTSAAAVLTINEKPEVTAHPANVTECEGGTVIYLVNPGVTTSPTYQWQVDQGSGFNDVSGGIYSGITNDTLTVSNITSAMNAYRYRVLVNGTCSPEATSNPARLYINEKPEVTQHPASKTICENDNVIFVVNPGVTTAPTFLWQYNTGSGWNPVPAAAPYSGTTNDTLTITGASSALNTYQYRAVVSGTCTPPVNSNAATLTVRIRPVITAQPIDRTICENANTTFTVNAGTTTSPTYQWQVDLGGGFNNVSGGVYSGATTATLTLTNVPSTMNTNLYRVVISGYCSPQAVSNTVLLTVHEKPEVTAQPADVTVCEDDNTSFTVNAGVTTSPVYQWQVDQGGGFNPVPLAAPYSGANTATLSITGVTSAMNTYKYQVVISGTCTPVATSTAATLTVRNKPEITGQPASQTICEDGNTTFTVNAGTTTSPTYTWQVDPNTGTFVNISGGVYSGWNSATLSVTGALSAMNGYRYRVIIGGACTPTVTSNIVTLTVNEKPEIVTHPANKTLCEDGSTSFSVDAGVTTNPTYQWEVNTGAGFNPVAGAQYTGATTSTLTINPVTSTMNAYLYHVVVSGTCTPSATSSTAVLYVNEKPEVTVPPKDSVICQDGNAAFSVNAGVTTNPTYRWQVNTGSGYADISDGGKYIGSSTSRLSIFNATADMDGYLYRVVISGTCTPDYTSAEGTLTVNTKPALTAHPADKTICEGTNTSFTVTATGTALTYTWQVDKNDGNGYSAISNGGVYSGATTGTLQLTAPTRAYNNYNYRVVVDGTCAPPMTSNIARLTVNTAPEILTEPSTSTICEFSNTGFNVVASGGSLTYQWQEDDGSGFSDLASSGNYIGVTSSSLNIFNIARTMDGYRYRVNITGICTPVATSAAVDLNVNTKPEILADPNDTTVCETLTAHFGVSAQGTALVYQWQEDGGGGFTNISNGGKYSGATSATLTVSNPTPLMTGYKYRVQINGTCVPSTLSDFAIMTVNTFPTIVTQPTAKEICEDGVTAFISNASGTGISYQWQEDAGSGFINVSDGGVYNGATSTTLTVSNAPVSMNGNKYRMRVIGACAPINSSEVALVVNANPTANISGDGAFPLICGGLDLNLDGTPTGGSGTYTTHTWSGDIVPLSAVNTQKTVFNTIVPGSYNLTYSVTDSKGCKTSDVTVITNERPQAQFSSDALPTCGVVTVNFTNQSSGAVSYEWDFDDPSDPAIVTEESPTHDFENFTTQIYYYNVSLVAVTTNGCGDTSRQVVTVYPSIDASFTVTPDEGCNPITSLLTAQPGGAQYYWDFDDGNAEYGGAAISHQFANTTGNTVVYTVELRTTSFYGCTDSRTYDVTVYPLPVVNFSADPVVQQYPDAGVIFTNLTPTGSWTYSWNYGDGNTSTETSPSHTYADPGIYEATLTAQTAECIDSISHQITITPASPVADFTQPVSDCAPLTIEFENLSQYANSYIWDFGNGSQSYKQSPSFTYYESGTYAVKLIVYGPGGSDNITRLVTVQQTPNAYANVAPTFVFVNDVPIKCFNLTTDTVNPTYLWNFGDDNSSNEIEPTHIYQEPGRYDIILTVTNDNACSNSYTFSYVDVEPAGEIIFPNVFRPNPAGPSGGKYRPGQDNNEIFFPGVYDQVVEYELTIYNRWGEQIFISKDVNIGWDGYIKNKLAEQGVYIWKVHGKYANGKTFNHAGDITLLR